MADLIINGLLLAGGVAMWLRETAQHDRLARARRELGRTARCVPCREEVALMEQRPELQAVPAITEQSCDGCKLADPYEPEVCLAHHCMAPYREDGRDVIWVEVTE